MKPGDIVRYAIFPHEELHFSGMTGLVLSKPKILEDRYGDLVTVDVMWSEVRIPADNNLNILRDAVDELEIINSGATNSRNN